MAKNRDKQMSEAAEAAPMATEETKIETVAVMEAPKVEPPKAEAGLAVKTGPGKYSVKVDDKSLSVEARDADEAWALFCDHFKFYPSPRRSGRVVEYLGAA